MALKVNPIENGKILWDAPADLNELPSLWQRLKTEVPEGVLQVHYEMTQIERKTEDQLPSMEKTQTLFDQFVVAFFPYFLEAGIPLNALPTPIACTQLQRALQQKWEDEALMSIWTKGRLRDDLKLVGALTGNGPQGLIEIRKWIHNHPEGVKRIGRLDLEKLEIKTCPPEIAAFHGLRYLDLSNNRLKYFGLNLSQLTKLELLHINSNQLSNFSSDLSKCVQLQNLSLARNNLANFSADLTHATNLQHLSLSCNSLSTFSSDLTHCSRLFWMSFDNNQLKNFSSDLSNCRGLYWIELGKNQLETFHFTPYPALFLLGLSHNQLKSFSYDLSPCTNLWALDIRNNQISSFDSNISNCKKLLNFTYSGNPNCSEWFKDLQLKDTPWIRLCGGWGH